MRIWSLINMLVFISRWLIAATRPWLKRRPGLCAILWSFHEQFRPTKPVRRAAIEGPSVIDDQSSGLLDGARGATSSPALLDGWLCSATPICPLHIQQLCLCSRSQGYRASRRKSNLSLSSHDTTTQEHRRGFCCTSGYRFGPSETGCFYVTIGHHSVSFWYPLDSRCISQLGLLQFDDLWFSVSSHIRDQLFKGIISSEIANDFWWQGDLGTDALDVREPTAVTNLHLISRLLVPHTAEFVETATGDVTWVCVILQYDIIMRPVYFFL